MTLAAVDRGALPVEALAPLWELGSWTAAEALPLGKSAHWSFTAGGRRYVVRRSYRGKTADGVRFEHELAAYLRERAFPAPVYVPTAAGEPCAELDGRLWRVAEFVPGRAARIAERTDTEVGARTLARYHHLAAGFTASVPAPAAETMLAGLGERVDEIIRLCAGTPAPAAADPLLAGLEATLARAQAVRGGLGRLAGELPVALLHGGCRRGSFLFDGNGSLAVVLDFDSARPEARALDVAVGLFDFAKLYGEMGSADYKVHCDLECAVAFLDAYQSVSPLSAAEIEAVPLFILAKRLKRALGRYARLLSGGQMSAGDRNKIALEEARVRSLDVLVAALGEVAT